MIEAVSDIIVARSREPAGLQKMIVVSIALHIVGVTAFMLKPPADYSDDVPRTVMTISLGGAPGPRAGGMTPMGGRAVQEVAPAEPTRRAETAPAPKAPEMALPRENARRPQAKPKTSPQEATGRRSEERRVGRAD